MKKITIVIADDHPLIRQGIITILEKDIQHHIIADTGNGAEALDLIIAKKPDIAILDVDMPGKNGLDVCLQIKKEKLNTKVIILTLHKELDLYYKAIDYGVDAYLLKEYALSELHLAIQSVMKNVNYFGSEIESLLKNQKSELSIDSDIQKQLNTLTKTEKDILSLISKQIKSSEIASKLFVSEKTIKNHRHNIIKKLNLPAEQNNLLKFAIEYANYLN